MGVPKMTGRAVPPMAPIQGGYAHMLDVPGKGMQCVNLNVLSEPGEPLVLMNPKVTEKECETIREKFEAECKRIIGGPKTECPCDQMER